MQFWILTQQAARIVVVQNLRLCLRIDREIWRTHKMKASDLVLHQLKHIYMLSESNSMLIKMGG